jgi:hypothetical protein
MLYKALSAVLRLLCWHVNYRSYSWNFSSSELLPLVMTYYRFEVKVEYFHLLSQAFAPKFSCR